MKAIILARVSTEEQREAGNSLPAQIVRMESYCKRKGFEIAETFSFDESAYKTKRDEFDKAVEYLENHKKEKFALCFDKVDRLSRNVFDKRVSLLYEKAVADEIELHFVSDGQIINPSMSAVEKFQFGMSLGLAKYYSDAISDNVKRAFEQKRRNGEWTGTPPIGYINTTLDNGKKDIIADPDRGHLIQALFDLYVTGNYSITTLWKKMHKLGLRNRAGKEVARSDIHYIINDPFYYGMARSLKYGLYPHRYPHLIDKELFDACQGILKGKRKMPAKMASQDFVFKGLIRCLKCGCLYTPELKKGKYVTYACTNGKHNCKRVYVSERILIASTAEVFSAFADIPQEVQDRLVEELRKSAEGEVDFHAREIKRIRAEYDRHQRRIENATDLLLDGSITKDEHGKIVEKEKDAQYKLNLDLEEHTKADHEYHIHVNTVLSLARRIGTIFAGSEVNEKRAIINFTLSNLGISDRKLTFSLRKPFDTILDLARSSKLAPRPGLEPGTIALHVSPCCHGAWTISSPWFTLSGERCAGARRFAPTTFVAGTTPLRDSLYAFLESAAFIGLDSKLGSGLPTGSSPGASPISPRSST